jgi:hypothetical protein
MIAKLQRAKTTAAHDSLVSETFSSEAPMIAEHADGPPVGPLGPSGRKLRNRIIVVNVIAWIAIIALVCLVFF